MAEVDVAETATEPLTCSSKGCQAAAAAVLQSGRRAAAIGSGLLSGVPVADAVYGLTVVADTTSPVYWTLVLVVTSVLLLAVAAARLTTLRLVGLQLATAAVVFVGASCAFAVLVAIAS
ncbi:MAG: DUF6518 family protein [Nocardioidaceae bacterium]|nr:DUF6518 family protein [Nocardioidaceae bacterium]